MGKIRKLIVDHKFDSVGVLLQALVPRAECFAFYDTAKNCTWSSDGTDDYEVDNYVESLRDAASAEEPSAELLRHTLPSGRTLLLQPIKSKKLKYLGILVLVFSKNTGKSSSFNPTLIGQILQPAVAILADTIDLHRDLDVARSSIHGQQKELEFVLDIDEKLRSLSSTHAGLARLVGDCGRFLNVEYSLLLIPGKRIRISATRSSWKTVNRAAIDAVVHERLIPALSGKKDPTIIDVPKVEGSSEMHEQGYQALVSPLFDQSGGPAGVMAFVAQHDNVPFGDRHTRVVAHVNHKLRSVIRESFDAKTGLMNRHTFGAQLREFYEGSQDTSRKSCLIYLDIDNLTLVNDAFGHAAGDEVIERFAQLLRELTPNRAIIGRLTGDEFALVLTGQGVSEGLQLAENIRSQIKALRYLKGDKSLQITVSIGMAELSAKLDPSAVLTSARLACDGAKDHGRDRVEIYDSNNVSIIRRYDDMQLVSDIQKAVDTSSFELLAQPIVALADSAYSRKYEVLLRMPNGEGELIPSHNLFSAAERYNLMPQIDRWVISSTLAILKEHREMVERAEINFSINLSGQTLGDEDLLEFIMEEIAHNEISPELLCFEITESAAVANRKRAQTFIDTLRRKGCRFSLDDFGAGLSSFAYLQNFNVDYLKIDGGFVRDISTNRISESMVTAITQVAKVMKLQTVAEYVETDACRDRVKKIGVDFAQGHAVGKAMPLQQVLTMLAEDDLTGTLTGVF